MGLIRNFHGKRARGGEPDPFGGPGGGGGTQQIFMIKIFCISPPPLQVFVNGPLILGVLWRNKVN